METEVPVQLPPGSPRPATTVPEVNCRVRMAAMDVVGGEREDEGNEDSKDMGR